MTHLIFDFDGTLVDTHPLIINSFLQTARKYGVQDPHREWLENNMGMELKQMIAKCIPNLADIDEAINLFRSYQMEKFIETVQLFDGVQDGLLKLKNLGYKMLIFTNKSTRFLPPILEKYNLQFDYILGIEDVHEPKPNPEGILKVAKLYQTDSTNCIMIGDSYADILCGKNANADHYAQNFDELVKIILNNYV